MCYSKHARIANVVTLNCQENKNCHEFRFSIVRIVISVSKVTSLQDCSLGVLSEGGRYVGRYVGRYIFFDQAMSPDHSHQISQRSQVSWIAPQGRYEDR